ncbi:hypothetical protein PF008_g13180 [Phytophthora fragariae]|uniref:Uncharacterized protein n=1 Tax=Phytophthora fragariae TaxID=53985 RepID=A0A6G0RLJ3_9STRA|nr:hypothetical protein PF008_g13180 [Phytophthora fragariae]
MRLELLAHAAVTVNRWALEADLDMHIAEDVITGRVSDRAATSLYISPRHTPPGTKGKRIRPTLWDTGVYLCNTYDGFHTVTEKADVVQALHCTSYIRGQLGLVWKGRRLHVNTTPMKGPLCHRYLAIETGEHGEFCEEWLPYAVLSEMRIFSEQGVVFNPNSRFRAICRRGLLLKDIL